MLLLLLGVSALPDSGNVYTNKSAYNPGETVHITINHTSNITALVIDPDKGQIPLVLTASDSGYLAEYSPKQGVILGTYTVQVLGENFSESSIFKIRSLSIHPDINERYPLGNVSIPGQVVDAESGNKVNASLDVTINNEAINGYAEVDNFLLNYSVNTTGYKVLTITAVDYENISGTITAGFEVYSSPGENLSITTSQPIYEAGQDVDIRVVSGQDIPIVWVVDPLGISTTVNVSGKDGVYSGMYSLDKQVILGEYRAEAETANPSDHVKAAFNVTAPFGLLTVPQDTGVEFSRKSPMVKDSSGKEVNCVVKIKGVGKRKGFQVSVRPQDHPVKEVTFHDLELPDGHTLNIGLDDVPEFGHFVEVYAIDPTELNFTSAIVTVTAKGTTLYKCKDWNFTRRECYGDWILFKTGLVPGQNYSFTLTPDDPGFGETGEPGNLEIYRIQPMVFDNDKNVKTGIAVYNPNSFDVDISGVIDTWSIDKVIKNGNIISSDPICTEDEASESVSWSGTYTIAANNYSIFKYTIKPDNPGNGVYSNVNFSNNDTSYTVKNVYIKDAVANAYLTISTNGVDFYEVVGPVVSNTNQTFTVKLEETGDAKKIKADTQFVNIDVPADWTGLGTYDADVSINGNMVVYDVPSDFRNNFQTFTFYATSPYLTDGWLFNSTLNGTDEGSYMHNDMFELLVLSFVPDTPIIDDITVTPNIKTTSNPVNITANITDNVNLSTVYINITLPNSTSTGNISMTNNSGNLWYYIYTPPIEGLYNFTIYANDTSDNWAYNPSSFVVENSPPTIDSIMLNSTLGEYENLTIGHRLRY